MHTVGHSFSRVVSCVSQAKGTKPTGGALYIEATNAVLLSSALFESNAVLVNSPATPELPSTCAHIALLQVSGLRGYGGAVHVMSGSAKFIACTLRGNMVKLLRTGWHASGGAAAVGEGGALELFDTQLLQNDAGGKGFYETLGLYKATSDAYRRIRAAHIDCAGKIALVNSKISPASGLSASSGEPDLDHRAKALITGNAAAAITFRDCSFESAVADTVLLRLIGSDSHSVIRGCTAVNVTVDVPGDDAELSTEMQSARFAVVNSTFEPPLPGLPMAVRPPHCSAMVAGERVCDPRATCRTKESGGVRCSCVDTLGLQDFPAVFPDGRRCEQATRVNLHVQSQKIILRAQKPGNYSEKLAVTANAEGETAFTALYSMGITHKLASDGNRTEVTWPSIHDQLLALHGFALLWDTPPSNDAEVRLNGDTSQFTAQNEYRFQLRLDCSGPDGKGRHCIADGDTVETVMHIGSPSDSSRMRSKVRFITEVEALVSCELSKAWVERDVLNMPPRSSFRVRLTAVDVDGLDVTFSRAEIAFLWGPVVPSPVSSGRDRGRDNRSLAALPVQWSRGSNEYTALVSEVLTEADGEYLLLVRVANGWSSANSSVQSCVLLERVINVIPDRSQVILAGCLASVLLLATAALAHLLYKNRGKALKLLLSFLSFEGLLVVETLLEVWGASSLWIVGHSVSCIAEGCVMRVCCLCPSLQIWRATDFSSPSSSRTGKRNGFGDSSFPTSSSSPLVALSLAFR